MKDLLPPSCIALNRAVRPYLTALAYPLSVDEVTLLQYLPYARRRISAVLPPLPPSPNRSTYAHKLHRIVTVPAPSTSEEKWRVYSRQFDGNSAEEDDNQSGIYEDDARRFEAEDATVKEPEELVIWVEGEISDSQMDLKRFVGIGLQGRWAMMGKGSAGEGANQWWSFEAKDCKSLVFNHIIAVDSKTAVLPAFWQSESIRSGDANLA